MKIIDLLNKRANGEEVPKKFKYKGETYIYKTYTFEDGDVMSGYGFEDAGWLNIWRDNLNDEVEIIEEDKDDRCTVESCCEGTKGLSNAFKELWTSVSNLLDPIFKLLFEEEKQIDNQEQDIEKLNKKHFHKKQRQLANKINEIIEVLNERL